MTLAVISRLGAPTSPGIPSSRTPRCVGYSRGALPAERMAVLERDVSRFGEAVVDTVGPAARLMRDRADLPELARYDSVGRRSEAVHFDAEYHRAGAAVWNSGLVADSGTPGRADEQATLLYLLSLEGEAGHACPAVCTIGRLLGATPNGEPSDP